MIESKTTTEENYRRYVQYFTDHPAMIGVPGGVFYVVSDDVFDFHVPRQIEQHRTEEWD